MTTRLRLALALCGAMAIGGAAHAAPAPAPAILADAVLVNGKIVTLDTKSTVVQALAVRDGHVLAVGTSDAMKKLAGPSTQVLDLHGRTVIPGLMDSHMHAIRAALFYATEVNWINTHSIEEAMERIHTAADAAKPGDWIIVAGGWTEQQFAEHRRPTQAELLGAAPNNPVYIQHFYDAVLLTPASFDRLAIHQDSDIPGQARILLDADGKPTGWIEGNNPAITGLFDKLPLPNFEQSVQGTKAFFRELNRLGMTAVLDPGGFNLTAESYRPLFKVWHDGELSLRVRFSMFAQRRGHELEDFKSVLAMMPMGFGDDMLRFNGIGENVTWGMYNQEHATDAQKEEYYQVALWAAQHGMTLTQHWNNNPSVGSLLDVFERVNKEVPLAPLRWSIAHLNDATDDHLERMKALGVGWTMQDAAWFQGEQFKADHPDQITRIPPIMTAEKMGLHIGGGTDAHRVMSYNPFVSLRWMVDGLTVSGMPTRGADELVSREQALRFYTQGSAWFTFEDTTRGSLEPGKWADLAVLSQDYLTVPTERIDHTQSVLTMVGGRVVYQYGAHGGMPGGPPGAMPAGHPAAGAMPSGHPAAMPAGHPATPAAKPAAHP